MRASGLEDILERIAEEKKRTEVKHSDSVQDDAESEIDLTKVPLRDREYTKDELMALEQKTWIEMKDLIFETDPHILDHLKQHC